MPKLQVTNVGLATVTIKDYEGYTDFVMDVATGITASQDVSRDLIQRLAKKLTELEIETKDASGNVLTGIRWSILASDDIDDRSMEEGLPGLPSLNELQAENYSTGGGASNVVATGTGLLGNQVQATKNIATADGLVSLDFTAVAPGSPGNAISVEIITPASTLDVSVAANKITIRPAAGGSTTAAIIAAVNADADAKLLVQAAIGDAGTINEAIAEANLEGGLGAGVSLTLNGTACILTEVTDTQLTFDIPTGISAASRIVPLEFQNGPHKSRMSVPVVA